MNPSATGGKPTECPFPARQLLAVRREMARKADTSKDPAVKRLCSEMVLHIEQLRLAHYDLTGCDCWYEAIRQEAIRQTKEPEQADLAFIPPQAEQITISEVYGEIEI